MPKISTKVKKTGGARKKPVAGRARKAAPPAKKAGVKKAAPKKAGGAKRPARAKKTASAATTRKAAKRPARSKRAEKLSFKKEITRQLEEARTRILQEVSQKVRSESEAQKREIGDIYDIASNERERELSLMFGDRDRMKLSEIEDALERIKDKTYGECGECGDPIAEKRLRALPFTRVCVDCQSRHERELRMRGKVEMDTGLGIMERSDSDEDEF